MSRSTVEATGLPEDVARALIRSVIAEIGPADIPESAREILEDGLAPAVVAAIALSLTVGVPFEATTSAMAQVLEHLAKTHVLLETRKEGLQ